MTTGGDPHVGGRVIYTLTLCSLEPLLNLHLLTYLQLWMLASKLFANDF